VKQDGIDLVFARSSAASAILLRLQQAALFETYQTRRAAVAALAKIALRTSDPVRFHVYQFFHTLQLNSHHDALNFDGGVVSGSAAASSDTLHARYRQAQAQLVAETESANAFCLNDIVAPAMAYLDSVYASLAHQGPGPFGISNDRPLLQDLLQMIDWKDGL
jgi:hypothetical protein